MPGGLTKGGIERRLAFLIDLNHILLFLAVASSLILLARLVRLRRDRPAGWMTASVLVLASCGISYLFAPALAGYIGGFFWALLLLFPSFAERKIGQLLLEKRYAAARNLAVVRRALHPWDDSPHLPALLRALELAQRGKLSTALDQLAAQRSSKTPAGRSAIAFTYALTENWSGLVEWCRRDLSVTSDPTVRALYLRGLGETGAVDEMAWVFAARTRELQLRLTMNPQSAQEFLFLLAFSGRTAAVVRLLRGSLGGLARDHQEFWIATAELAAGCIAAARSRLERLRGQTTDAILLRAIEQRLTHAESFSSPRLTPPSEKLLDRLIAETSSASPIAAPKGMRAAPAVWSFIFLNLAMFGVELVAGGATNEQTLHFLGALEPYSVIVRHQYWRLLTALFLHYGVLHIAFNLYALYLLGPSLERMIGSLKFALGYLVSGLGSCAGVVFLQRIGLTSAGQLVGASGCVMGVIGISAGLLMRHRQTPLVGRRLREILIIVAFQTIFDLLTPQVSLAAHLSGFLTGLLIGLGLSAREIV